MTEFLGPAISIAKMLSEHGRSRGDSLATEIRFLLNRSTRDELAKRFPELSPGMLVPSESESAEIQSHLVDWYSEGVPRWVELLRGGPITSLYESIIERVYSTYQFDIVVYWGTNAAARNFANRMQIPAISMELGCTRLPYLSSIYFDPFGVNGAAVPANVHVDALRAIPDIATSSAKFDLLSYSASIDPEPFDQRFKPFHGLEERLLHYKGRKPIAFVPLQLHDDANLLMYSSYGSPADFLQDVLPRLEQAGYVAVVKPHPSMNSRPGGDVEQHKAQKICREFGNVIWFGDASLPAQNPRLFELSDAVVTVNSSAGFEATLHGTNVFLCGQASYGPVGLFPGAEEIGTFEFARQYQEDVSRLRGYFLDGYLVPEREAFSLDAFVGRISALAAIAERKGSSTEAIFRAIYDQFGPPTRLRRLSALRRGIGHQPRISPKPQPASPQSVKAPTQKPTPTAAANSPTPHSALGPPPAERVVKPQPSAVGNTVRRVLGALARPLRHRYEKAVIRKSGRFDGPFYLAKYPDVADAGMDPLDHYVRHGAAEYRNPNPNFDAQAYVRRLGSPADWPDNPLLHAIQRGEADASTPVAEPKPTVEAQIQAKSAPKPAPKPLELVKPLEPVRHPLSPSEQALVDALHDRLGGYEPRHQTALVAHIFYKDLAEELLDRIAMFSGCADIYVSVAPFGSSDVVSLIQKRVPSAFIYTYPNRGRDVAPFLALVPHLVRSEYSIVGKIHSKKGVFIAGKLREDLGAAWRRYSLATLLPGPEVLSLLTDWKGSHPNVALFGPRPFLLEGEKNYGQVKNIVHSLQHQLPKADEWAFVAGTMFWATGLLVDRISSLALDLESFAPETGQSDGGLEHAVERIIGYCAGDVLQSVASLDLDEKGQIVVAEGSFATVGVVPFLEKLERHRT